MSPHISRLKSDLRADWTKVSKELAQTSENRVVLTWDGGFDVTVTRDEYNASH